MSEAEKSDEKSSSRLPDGRVAPGRGPAKGAPNAGRPRGTYREWLTALLERDDHQQVFEAALRGELGDKAFAFATKHAAAYGHGLPAVTIQGPDGGPVQVQVVNSPGFKP